MCGILKMEKYKILLLGTSLHHSKYVFQGKEIEMKEKYGWLQLSDLHVYNEADTIAMKKSFFKLAEVIHPSFIIVTGDFRDAKEKTKYKDTCAYLSEVISYFHVDRSDVYLIPGNHDAKKSTRRVQQIKNITDSMKTNCMLFQDILKKKPAAFFKNAFSDYSNFVKEFYSDTVNDSRVTNPAGCYMLCWKNRLNILHLNTALISDGDSTHEEIFNVTETAKILEADDNSNNLPVIVIGHHGIDSLYTEFAERLHNYLELFKASAYLHGDIHKYRDTPYYGATPDQIIPAIACGKSAPRAKDKYSDLGVIYYSCNENDEVTVTAFKWSHKQGFTEYCEHPFVTEINKKRVFKLLSRDNTSFPDPETPQEPTKEFVESDYCSRIIKGNKQLTQRDQLDYYPKPWVDVYTKPIFCLEIGNKEASDALHIGVYDKTLILSPSGYGKSKLIQGLALCNAVASSTIIEDVVKEKYKKIYTQLGPNKEAIPIIIRGSDYNKLDQKESLLDYASYSVEFGGFLGETDYEIVKQACIASNATVFIDSFDEISASKTELFFEHLSDFLNTYQNVNVLITSRPVEGIQSIKNLGFSALAIKEFEESQIREQLRKRVDDESIENVIIQRILSNPYKAEMARNPLMLSVMIRKMRTKDYTVKQLLEFISDTIIQNRWAEADILSKEDIKRFLGALAWTLIKDETLKTPTQTVTGVFETVCTYLEKMRSPLQWKGECLAETNQKRIQLLYDYLSRRSGILSIEEDGLHITFQDAIMESFFGAEHIKFLIDNCYKDYSQLKPDFLEELSKNNIELISSEQCIFKRFDDEIGEKTINNSMMNSIVISFSMIVEKNQLLLLKYILYRGTITDDEDEREIIVGGVMNLKHRTFGGNNVLNPQGRHRQPALSFTEKWLECYGNKEKDEQKPNQ